VSFVCTHSSIFPSRGRPSRKFFKQTKCVYSSGELAEYECVCFRDEQSEKPITNVKIYDKTYYCRSFLRIEYYLYLSYYIPSGGRKCDSHVSTLYGHHPFVACESLWGVRVIQYFYINIPSICWASNNNIMSTIIF